MGPEPSRARRRGRWRLRQLAQGAAAVWLGRVAVRCLGASLRVSEANRGPVERLWAAGVPLIYAVWHGQMLMLPYLYGRSRPVHVLISRSRDGEVLARFVRGFGIRVVRGSSSRGGPAALRQLRRLLVGEGAEVLVAPDGPRGPRAVAQPGTVLLAKLSGAPIVPLAVGASRRTVLSSWDRFVIPHPFARVVVAFGEPLRVPAAAAREEIEACRQALERALGQATRQAEELAGAPGVRAL